MIIVNCLLLFIGTWMFVYAIMTFIYNRRMNKQVNIINLKILQEMRQLGIIDSD